MKELYKKRSGQNSTRTRGRGTEITERGGSYGTRRRGRKHNRRNGAILLVVFVLLAAVVTADYLANEGEILQFVRFGGPVESGETKQAAAPVEEAVEGGRAEEDPAAGMSLLGEYFTDYAWDPDPGRQSNLKMSAEAIDGTRLAPGEEFSAIEVLSPLDYEPAKVFADGGVSYEVGGGLCQVSSTLYMAANYAGLEITERNQHYAELPYIKPGLDATVWFGIDGTPALDMKFKNNTDGDLLIRQFVNEDGFMVAQIWGEEPTNKTVSMNSEKVEEDLGKGITWATYKKVTDEEEGGEVLEDGLLFESTYSYNPPKPDWVPGYETNEPRGAGWVDSTNTTNWNKKG